MLMGDKQAYEREGSISEKPERRKNWEDRGWNGEGPFLLLHHMPLADLFMSGTDVIQGTESRERWS